MLELFLVAPPLPFPIDETPARFLNRGVNSCDPKRIQKTRKLGVRTKTFKLGAYVEK